MIINLNTLEKKYNSLTTEFGNLEEIKLNLFNNLSAIYNMDWKDGNSYNWGNEIEEDRLETDSLLMNINSKINVLSSIYNKYCVFGKKISMDLNQKGTILSAIDTCITQIDSILSQFDSTDLNFYYPEFSILRNKKSNYQTMRSNLSLIRDEYDSMFTKVETIENEIAEIIRGLEEILIKEYSFNFSEKSEYALGATLIENAYDLDCGKVEFYKNEENISLTKIYNTLNILGAYYVSPNVNLFRNNIINLKQCITDITNKRVAYMSTLYTVPSLYGIAIEKSNEIFKEEKDD